MEKKSLDRKVTGKIELDLCFPCRSIWFDRYESLQLQPASVIELFRAISAHSDDQPQQLPEKLACPRCGDPLAVTMDRSKSGAFNYLRCMNQHGHFIVFGQFMIEKGFVRQLGGDELKKLKADIGIVRCAGCGAPVDIRKDSACTFCHAPIAILDPQAVESALANYQREADKRTLPQQADLLADSLMDEQRVLNRSMARERMHEDIGDMLIEGVVTAWRLMRRH